jgi:hypothetical protein
MPLKTFLYSAVAAGRPGIHVFPQEYICGQIEGLCKRQERLECFRVNVIKNLEKDVEWEGPQVCRVRRGKLAYRLEVDVDRERTSHLKR